MAAAAAAAAPNPPPVYHVAMRPPRKRPCKGPFLVHVVPAACTSNLQGALVAASCKPLVSTPRRKIAEINSLMVSEDAPVQQVSKIGLYKATGYTESEISETTDRGDYMIAISPNKLTTLQALRTVDHGHGPFGDLAVYIVSGDATILDEMPEDGMRAYQNMYTDTVAYWPRGIEILVMLHGFDREPMLSKGCRPQIERYEGIGYSESEISNILAGEAPKVASFVDSLTLHADGMATGVVALGSVARAITDFFTKNVSKKVAEWLAWSPEVGYAGPMHLSAAQFSVELVSDQIEVLNKMGYSYSEIFMIARGVAFMVDRIFTQCAVHYNEILTNGGRVAPTNSRPISNITSDHVDDAVGGAAEPSLAIDISGPADAKILGDKIHEGVTEPAVCTAIKATTVVAARRAAGSAAAAAARLVRW